MYRKIPLNPIRNAEDFRYAGRRASNDKSVHQFRAIELPMDKVLVSVGQNASGSHLLIFDPVRLYETERKEDFSDNTVFKAAKVYLNETLFKVLPSVNA